MRIALLAMTSAAALALPVAVHATGPYPTSARQCSDKIEAETAKFVTTVQDEIRGSIKKNLQKVKSPCSGDLVCAGGPKNGKACTTNATCGSAGGIPFQCRPKTTAGIAGAINTARTNLRNHIAASCSAADRDLLFGANSGSIRCPDPTNPPNGLDAGELANCILRTALGRIADGRLRGTVGELLGSGAPDFAVDNPIPTGICGVALGGITEAGSLVKTVTTLTSTGTLAPLLADGCTAGNPLCHTKGQGLVGNLAEPPQQVATAPVAVCVVTTLLDAGNGTPESGWIDFATGEQHSYSPVAVAILVGITCPVCDKTTKVCLSVSGDSPHEGHPCGNPGDTDVACPPVQPPAPAFLGEPVDFSTEPHVLTVPAHNPTGGVTNSAGAFCGSCDHDATVGCASDGECAGKSLCDAGVGAGCCVFGSNKGAFGDATATTIQLPGTRGPFLPQLAALSCVGKTGSGVIDGIAGLPGPMRSVQLRLNALQY